MRLGSYMATAGAMQEQRRLDVIANNMANVTSPGFKKDSTHFDNLLGQVTFTSFQQGPIRETGHKLDLALSGQGFLKVQADSGLLFTRAGNLTVDGQKNLVTQDGWKVLGKSGPIKVENADNVRFGEDGQIFDGNTATGSLDIVTFAPGVELKKVEGGYFQPDSTDAAPMPASNCTVRQAALEGPNFNPVEEMVRMVESLRTFESFQKTIQTFDRDLDGQLIAKLAG